MDTRQTDAANELWRRHSQDEATARAAQQERAGQAHRPVDGPPPYGNEEVNLLAAEITAGERERCARLVEAWAIPPGADGPELLRQVAAGIRHQP